MIKKFVIFVLILLVLGLYFYTEQTKEGIQSVGNAVKDKTINLLDETKEKAAEKGKDIIKEIND